MGNPSTRNYSDNLSQSASHNNSHSLPPSPSPSLSPKLSPSLQPSRFYDQEGVVMMGGASRGRPLPLHYWATAITDLCHGP